MIGQMNYLKSLLIDAGPYLFWVVFAVTGIVAIKEIRQARVLPANTTEAERRALKRKFWGIAAFAVISALATLSAWFSGDKMEESVKQNIAETAKANDRAAKADERAANAEERAAKANKALAEMKPRRITEEQRKAFISALEGLPRGRVRVVSSRANSETYTFAKQVRQILDDAGYGLTNATESGIEWREMFYQMPIGQKPDAEHDLIFAFHGDRSDFSWPGITFLRGNGLVKMDYNRMDPRAIPAIVHQAFRVCGLKTASQGINTFLKPGEWCVALMDRAPTSE